MEGIGNGPLLFHFLLVPADIVRCCSKLLFAMNLYRTIWVPSNSGGSMWSPTSHVAFDGPGNWRPMTCIATCKLLHAHASYTSISASSSTSSRVHNYFHFASLHWRLPTLTTRLPRKLSSTTSASREPFGDPPVISSASRNYSAPCLSQETQGKIE